MCSNPSTCLSFTPTHTYILALALAHTHLNRFFALASAQLPLTPAAASLLFLRYARFLRPPCTSLTLQQLQQSSAKPSTMGNCTSVSYHPSHSVLKLMSDVRIHLAPQLASLTNSKRSIDTIPSNEMAYSSHTPASSPDYYASKKGPTSVMSDGSTYYETPEFRKKVEVSRSNIRSRNLGYGTAAGVGTGIAMGGGYAAMGGFGGGFGGGDCGGGGGGCGGGGGGGC